VTTADHPRPSCPVPTRDGRPCRGTVRASGRCLAHDPTLDLDGSRRRGGRHRSTAHRSAAAVAAGLPDPLRGVLDGLLDVFDGVRAGTVPPARAHAAAAVGRAILTAWDAGVTDARLAAVERHVAAVTGRPVPGGPW
jgi:hypothetical protein